MSFLTYLIILYFRIKIRYLVNSEIYTFFLKKYILFLKKYLTFFENLGGRVGTFGKPKLTGLKEVPPVCLSKNDTIKFNFLFSQKNLWNRKGVTPIHPASRYGAPVLLAASPPMRHISHIPSPMARYVPPFLREDRVARPVSRSPVSFSGNPGDRA